MAGDKVKKGFFFYLLIFLILIAAFIGICVVIMICNPGKNVLSFAYFNGSGTYEIVETTDESQKELKIGETVYSEIQVETNMASVVLDNNTQCDKNCIVVSNNATGFAKSSDIQPFEYSVVVEDSVLKIKVEAPKGFLYFSKNVEVKIHMANIANISAFTNTKLTIKTTGGDVIIGGGENVGYSEKIYPASLDIETESGNIFLTKMSTNSYRYLNLKTESGTIDITAQSTETANLTVLYDFLNVSIGNGNFKAGIINNSVYFDSNKGKIEVEKITGDIQAKSRSTIFNIKEITGDLDFYRSTEIMDSCKIAIDQVRGIVNIPSGRNSNVQISSVLGDVNIHTTSGSVELGSKDKTLSQSVYVETNNGAISTYFGDSNKSKFLISEKGNITANYVSSIKGQNIVTSKEGNIYVNFNANSKVKFVFDIVEPTEDNKFNLSNVKFDILNDNTLQYNPYYYNSTEATIDGAVKIITNKVITLDII